MHWPASKDSGGSGSRQRRKQRAKQQRQQQADDADQAQDQGPEEPPPLPHSELGRDRDQQQQQQQQQQAQAQAQAQQQEQQQEQDQANQTFASAWDTYLAVTAAAASADCGAAGPSAAAAPAATPPPALMQLVSVPLCCSSTTSSCSGDDDCRMSDFADAHGTPPASPFADLAVSGEPFVSVDGDGSDAGGSDGDAVECVDEPTGRLPKLPASVAAAAAGIDAALALTSALDLEGSFASYESSLARNSTASDGSSSSGGGARRKARRGGAGQEGAPGGMLRVDTVPLLSLLARADSPPDSVATVPSGSGSDTGEAPGPAAAAAAAAAAATAAAEAAGRPALSPARARLIARLQQRQRERELEEAASCDLGAFFGEGCPPPAGAALDGLVLVAGGAMIPHVAKTRTGGEDAYFTTASGHGALAVADGVSSWAADGVDPGDYSRTLVQNLQHLMEQAPAAAPPAVFEGRTVLRRAQMATLKPGSATVVLAALRPRTSGSGGGGGAAPAAAAGPAAASSSSGCSSHEALDVGDWDSVDGEGDGGSSTGGGSGCGGAGEGLGAFELHISNLGDCGIKVVRDGSIILATQPQQHEFNLPYQMSHPRLFPETDIADSADRYVMDVREGDVIIAASDGLFDNLWDAQLLQVLSDALAGRAPPPLPPPRLRRATKSFKGLSSRLKRGGSKASLTSSGSFPALRRVASESCAAPAPAAAAAAAAAAPEEPSDVDPGSLTPGQLAQRAADALVRVAFRNAGDDRFKSPWAAAAKKQGLMARLFAHGGKMDDCTAVVAIVREARAVAASEAAAPR